MIMSGSSAAPCTADVAPIAMCTTPACQTEQLPFSSVLQPTQYTARTVFHSLILYVQYLLLLAVAVPLHVILKAAPTAPCSILRLLCVLLQTTILLPDCFVYWILHSSIWRQMFLSYTPPLEVVEAQAGTPTLRQKPNAGTRFRRSHLLP